jgi:copper chaperone
VQERKIHPPNHDTTAPGFENERSRIQTILMALKLTVPTLNSSEAAVDPKETILTSEPQAHVEIDPESQTVTIESQASEETFKQLITAAGHTIA